MASLLSGLVDLESVLSRVDLGHMEMLVGVDGCVAGQTTHLQTVIHLRARPEVSLRNTTTKLYPAGDESESLIGWHICWSEDRVPNELATARRVQTSVGTILVLVCNDAAIFSARSRANLAIHSSCRFASTFWIRPTLSQGQHTSLSPRTGIPIGPARHSVKLLLT